MPLFILVSGYFAAKSIARRGKKALLRYLQRLVLPCASMGMVFLFLTWLKGNNPLISLYIGASSLWFLIVVLQCLFFYSIMLLKKNWL